MSKLENRFHSEFVRKKPVPWVTLSSGRVAGEVRAAGGGDFSAGNIAFVQIYEAGCVPRFGDESIPLTDIAIVLQTHGAV